MNPIPKKWGFLFYIVFIHMKETNMIPQITKLLKNFIFNEFDLDFTITFNGLS